MGLAWNGTTLSEKFSSHFAPKRVGVRGLRGEFSPQPEYPRGEFSPQPALSIRGVNFYPNRSIRGVNFSGVAPCTQIRSCVHMASEKKFS